MTQEQNYTVYFTKLHTKGMLRGLTTNDRISFATLESASQWIRTIQTKGDKGKLPYHMVDHSFQNYVRN